jgi:tetratricopeptide (TPR) repeat protein
VIRIDKGDPGCVWDYYQRATPLWILGRREEALADYERFRVAHGRPFFADARMFIILRELDRNEEASAVLEAALQRVADPMGKAIFSCLAGRINPDTLLAAAGEDREHRCEACYYAGEYLLLADRPDEARKWFTACVNTGVTYDVDALTLTPMNEYELAQWRLETLPQPPAIEDPEKN